MNKIKLVLAVALYISAASSQVKVFINSGDPVFPFPQFQPYKNNTSTYNNLATMPGVGVTHAEMEQVIRDGYQIMMNRAEKPGGGVGGKDYIMYRSNPQCSEGDGYGLLGAAAMADKETFDGMWLYIHDFTMNKVKRYSDCKDASPGYNYSHLPGWTGAGANSAADGDFDIALALLTAYLQWGEFMGIDDACGEPISYKKEAIEFLKGLSDTLIYSANGNYLSGDIGLDGYIKGGDSWAELTNWASNTSVSGFSRKPDCAGPTPQHIDYAAPAYFRAFADFLAEEDSAKYAWNIYQFRRAEASSDWLMGKMLDNESMIPMAGWVELSADNVPTFTTFSDGEDFRCSWRTILNELWHGNPQYTWDPKTHQIKNGAKNSFEMDIGKRYARFLWDQRQDPWNSECTKNVGGDKTIGYWGPEILKYQYSPEGEPLTTFALNWVPGSGSPAAVVSQNHDLMAELYRCLEMKWDSENEERYLESVPKYFHGWFRMLGLLVLSGNYHAPLQIKPTANMKVYLSIDRTFAFEGDTVTYSIDYRNYGSLDAKDIVISDTLHRDFVYISSTGGGVFDAASNSVRWNIKSVPGVKSKTDLSDTKGQVKLTVKVSRASQQQYRNNVSITCSNGSGWTSNEYPNNITPVMERNYLDIAKRALIIEKKLSNNAVNPGNEIEVNLNFENTSEAGWINGGRSGVHFSYSTAPLTGGVGSAYKMRFRLFHDADEAYIDYGNYRVSYYLFDPGNNCYEGTEGCADGWVLNVENAFGIVESNVKVLHQKISEGFDQRGKWNQRIVLQFSDVNDPNREVNLTTTNYHLDWYRGNSDMIHRGGKASLFVVWRLNNGKYSSVDWSDDWSYNSEAADGANEPRGFPITNDWTDPDNPNIEVNRLHPKECSEESNTIKNILVEEWDGYTWRRVAGDGPLPGRDVENVVIRDTVPPGFVFVSFEGKPPLGIEPTVKGNVITWTIPKLQVKQKGSIRYVMKADGTCPMQKKNILTRAWISADKESPFYDSAQVLITCDPVPPPPPEPTTMYKTADRKVYKVDDTINYTIAYKQTHGTIITDATNPDKWIDVAGNGKLSLKDDEISYDKGNSVMVYKYSYGTNGTIGGTATPIYYGEFSIVLRNSGSKYIELRFKQDWDQMYVSFFDDGEQIGGSQGFIYNGFKDSKPFDYKIELAGDTIRLWAGDTAALMPNVSQSGFSVRSGYAGVKSGKDTGARIKGWSSHLDAGFNINISDSIPDGIRFIEGSGVISTGALAGTELDFKEDDGTLKWTVVSGDSYLSFGDSVTIDWKGVCETCNSEIINTAFTNIQGHKKNSIGAQVKSGCQAKPGEPDHVDIIIDTLDIDLLNDSEIDSIFMDAGTMEFELFAVVRDSIGNYLEQATLGKWSSRDAEIVSVETNSESDWGAVITKTGSGKTVITVSQNGLKSDSVIIIAEAKPLWPVITNAIVLDNNGDIVPDELRITLTDTFATNQKVNNVLLSYRGQSFTFELGQIEIEDKTIFVPLNFLTEPDASPEGTVTLNMLIDSQKKQSMKNITDGIGAAISEVILSEEVNGKSDTLFLKFPERVILSTLKGKTVQLIKKETGDTVYLDLYVLPGQVLDSIARVVTTAPEKNRPQQGDYLRLVPGEADGTVSDYHGNLPHLKNQAVPIKAKPPQINLAWYKDKEGDGVVDAVYLKFLREVEPEDILFSLTWSGVIRLEKITSEHFSYNSDNFTLKVNLPDSFKTDAGVKTSTNMFAVISFKSYPELIRNSVVFDSVAPVIESATIAPGEYTEGDEVRDILSVYFSEDVKIDPERNPFLFIRKRDTEYKIENLEVLNTRGDLVTFTFTTVSGVDYPENNDSIWIDPNGKVGDENDTRQTYSTNRRVPLAVKNPKGAWNVKVGPNPFNPDSVKGIRFYVVQESRHKAKAVAKDIMVKIYDAMGNVVFQSNKYSEDETGFSLLWNGYNRKNRKAGKGSYSAVIVVEDEDGKKVFKKLIGVKK